MLQIDLKGKIAFIAGIGHDLKLRLGDCESISRSWSYHPNRNMDSDRKNFHDFLGQWAIDESRLLSNGNRCSSTQNSMPLTPLSINQKMFLKISEKTSAIKYNSGYTVSEVASQVAKTSDISISWFIASLMAQKLKNLSLKRQEMGT